jgi:hypothetical protein
LGEKGFLWIEIEAVGTPSHGAHVHLEVKTQRPAASASGEKAQAMLEVYATDLSAFPVWAIDRAGMKIRDSGAKWLPSSPEILKMVDAECRFAVEEAEDIAIILAAEPYKPRLQTCPDRITAAFSQLRVFLDKTANPRRQTREAAERAIASDRATRRPITALRAAGRAWGPSTFRRPSPSPIRLCSPA